jgi:hypothetical protein
VFFSALNLALYPVLTVIEGCGRVADLQKMRLWQAISGALCVWAVILTSGGLLAASILAGINFAVSIVWCYRNFEGLLRQTVLDMDQFPSVDLAWRKEILPMQWRIALSWMSGYLISQLFNPLLFHYQGATVAGQMGMSMSIANVALTVSLAWITTKTPLYGSLIQKRQYRELDAIALKSTFQAMCFSVFMSIMVLLGIYLLKQYFHQYGERLLSLSAIGALLLSNLTILLITSMAGYLRAHKAEPLLAVSIISGVIIAVSAWLSAMFYTAEILTYSLACANLLIVLPLTAYVFIRKRAEWHEVTLESAIN